MLSVGANFYIMKYNNDVDALFAMADLAFSENRIEEAKGLLEEILFIDPHYGRAYNHLGWFYMIKIEDAEKAEELFNLALKYSPNYPAAYYHMARLYMQTRRLNEAMDILNKALKLPMADEATIYDLIGGIYENKGNNIKAFEYLKMAKTKATNNEFIEYLKGEMKRVKSKLSPWHALTTML